ncbi:cupin domain-containing protein [Brevibacillus sp. TJ4]|uniref:cupin domain-containing protein n=1 Tax=Brevibacillus sp. TJ4 TaxID=3234853 RepID=UPI0037D732FC
MAISYMDYTAPNVQFSSNVNENLFFRKDARNYINVLSIQQLNTLGNVSLLDIFLSTSNVIEPHYHQNASELVYCISGAAVVSLLNPFTKELLHFPIGPGQVANVPQGWWHYEVATVDNTHLLAIFDAPIPEFIGGSDLLRLTPPEVWAHTYCLDERQVRETLAPITETVFIGPPNDCARHPGWAETKDQPVYEHYEYHSEPYYEQLYRAQAYDQQLYPHGPGQYPYPHDGGGYPGHGGY